MAFRNRNPQDPRQSESLTRRVVSYFEGMVTGEPASKLIPKKNTYPFSTLNYNVIDRGQSFNVRSGSNQYTTLKHGYTINSRETESIPNHFNLYLAATGTDRSKPVLPFTTGDEIYFSGTLPNPLVAETAYYVAVTGPTAYTSQGDPIYDFIKMSVYSSRMAALVARSFQDSDPNGIIITEAKSGIVCSYGIPTAYCDHVKSKKLILKLGNTVYISDKSLSILTRVLNLSTVDPQGESTIVPFNDDAIIGSLSGIYKIVLSESFYYMYPINNQPPTTLIENTAQSFDSAGVSITPYEYLYLYSLGRINGSGNRNRITDEAVLNFESGTNLNPGKEVDYGSVFFEYPIGEDVTQDHVIGDIVVYADKAPGITHAPLYRSKDIGVNGIQLANNSAQVVWVEDVPVCKSFMLNVVGTTATIDEEYDSQGDPTVVTNHFVNGDIGSILRFTDGSIAEIMSLNSDVEAVLYFINYESISNPISCCIGGFRTGTCFQTGYQITVTRSLSPLWAGDVGSVMFLSDGSMRHITNVLYREFDTTLVQVAEEGEFTELAFGMRASLQNQSDLATVVAYQRKWNDTVPDLPQADGRVSLDDRIASGSDLYVPRRMFRGMPNCNILHLDSGFMVGAVRDTMEYRYCQTGDKGYTIGQYKYPEQYRPITGTIRSIESYPNAAIFLCKDRTGMLTLNSSSNIGRTAIGENIFQLSELSIVDNQRGVVAWSLVTHKASNLLYALTSDSAFRYFDGTSWGTADYAFIAKMGLDAVSKDYLKKVDHNNVYGANYNSNGGIKLWMQILQSGSLVDKCLRFSTELSEGEGWSEFGGSDWVFPINGHGVLQFLDDNDVQRVVVIDKTDHCFYEIDTFDKTTIVKQYALDKTGVKNTEIAWIRRGIEHVVGVGAEEKYLLHERSYVSIRPDDVANRGATGYTATGQRTAQELTLKVFLDGEVVSDTAEADDFPENGEVVFVGQRIDAQRVMLEISGTAGEIIVTTITDDFLIQQKAPAPQLRVMNEQTLSLSLLQGMILWITRSKMMMDRITGKVFDGFALTKELGPDGDTASGYKWTNFPINQVSMDNPAVESYTLVFWAKAYSSFNEVAATVYGDAVGDWSMYYLRGTELPAAITMAYDYYNTDSGEFFDVRIYNRQLSDAEIAFLYKDIARYSGKQTLPGDVFTPLPVVPVPLFTVSATNLTVQVTDASTGWPTSWSWDWGDGNTSIGQYPSAHTYDTGGTYNITLTVSNMGGANSIVIPVTVSSPVSYSYFGFGFLNSDHLLYGSNDMTAWTLCGSLPAGVRNVRKFGSLLIAVGDNGLIATSTNGQTWVTRAGTDGDNFKDVIFINNVYLAFGSTPNTVLYSDDGIIWSYWNCGGLDYPEVNINRIVQGNGVWLALIDYFDEDTENTINLILSAPLNEPYHFFADTHVIINANISVTDLIFDPVRNLFVTYSFTSNNGKTIQESSDGVHWSTVYTAPSTPGLRAMGAFAGDGFCQIGPTLLSLRDFDGGASGAAGDIVKTTDGASWTPIFTGMEPNAPYGITSIGGIFVAFGYLDSQPEIWGNRIATSETGDSWTIINPTGLDSESSEFRMTKLLG